MQFFSFGSSAVGVIAIGQEATGIIAIGQMATGVFALGQLARGFIAIGQLACGVVAVGQLTIGIVGGVGMVGLVGRGIGWVIQLLPVPQLRETAPETTTFDQLRSREASGYRRSETAPGGWLPVLFAAAGDDIEVREGGDADGRVLPVGIAKNKTAAARLGTVTRVPALAYLESVAGTWSVTRIMRPPAKPGFSKLAPLQLIGLAVVSALAFHFAFREIGDFAIVTIRSIANGQLE